MFSSRNRADKKKDRYKKRGMWKVYLLSVLNGVKIMKNEEILSDNNIELHLTTANIR